MRIRALVALAALLACASKSAHATSPVQTARAEGPVAAVEIADASSGAPVSPLAIAGTLGATGDLAADPVATGGPVLQIQLRTADPRPYTSPTLDHDRSVDVNPQDL